jgi:hypothetical protein
VIVNAMSRRRITGSAIVALAITATGCGQYVRDSGRAPAQIVIQSLAGASGAEPAKFFSSLGSDVVTNVTKPAPCTPAAPCPTIFGDLGQVTMSLILKDPGSATSPASPSALNQITITRYHVTYRRTDGRNTPGVDVPYPFDSATTFTVPESGNVTGGFQLVRNDAKLEAPLLALRDSAVIIDAIADVTFYGRDQAGNDVSATGSIQVNFGNFADPQ